MGKTAGPLRRLRRPRHDPTGQVALISHEPRALASTAPAVLLQGLRQHVHIRA
jgi:hypothetical protein